MNDVDCDFYVGAMIAYVTEHGEVPLRAVAQYYGWSSYITNWVGARAANQGKLLRRKKDFRGPAYFYRLPND